MLLLQESYGDISERLLIREKLKCHSFEWYLKNIYPELHIPEDTAEWHGAVSVYYTYCILILLHLSIDTTSVFTLDLYFVLVCTNLVNEVN